LCRTGKKSAVRTYLDRRLNEMFLLVDKMALRLIRDEYVEHSLLIIQRRKFGTGLKTAGTEVRMTL
jgi:hypothetical protein